MKKIVYVDIDDTLVNFTRAYNHHRKYNPGIEFPQSQYGFFTKLMPFPGAIDAMWYMLASDKYDVYILTAPSVKNPLCYTEKRIWVEEHLGEEFLERLIISPNKGLSKGHYLIDDCCKGRGQENFEGELIQFGTERYPDWKAVREKLGV